MKVSKPGYLTKVKMKPYFTHDCTTCIYLGSARVNKVRVDFYAHERPKSCMGVDLIYRTSSEESEYGCTHPQYANPLSLFGCMALSLYIKHLGANSCNCSFTGSFFKDNKLVLKV